MEHNIGENKGSRGARFANQIRERVSEIVFGAGLFLMIGCWFSLILGGAGVAAYAGWIALTKGRDALLTSWGIESGPLGLLIGGAWVLAFVFGVALTWIGGRISTNPKNRVNYSWKGLLHPPMELVQLAAVPSALCFLFLWLILRLDFGLAVWGTILLVTAFLTLADRHQFYPLSDPKSPLLVKNRDRFDFQTWFCGECNKHFMPTHWLVQADTSCAPSYVAQCPKCKGGNTQPCQQNVESEFEEAAAKCNVCGAPPFSAACHRYRDRKAEA